MSSRPQCLYVTVPIIATAGMEHKQIGASF